ncbi:CBS domain containing protein [Gottschalkia acidurici 9a]|uniref:CBS domain containing protein n=1 Tax=Gottschalkia acidurici (strain ATCC 7906 / DSM 604 / BCRC 14475 / CIP 104303 / KCTC 5404 / NCIMB 10678 / 9a) TaxID=1128398 RepID=K0AVM8_GOTA9|nr:CBS domain-containing protein [Gottschalkia acidurici]AFS77334.1 CBS domain containing protein [Gottschalkia acidurici 9a]
MLIKDIMTKPAITVSANDTIGDILYIMSKNNINGAPVIDKENSLIGMIVKADIYRFMIEPGHIADCPVDWVMSKSPITCESEEYIDEVARRLRENNIVAMPVLEDKKVVGVISFEDIIDHFLESYSK